MTATVAPAIVYLKHPQMSAAFDVSVAQVPAKAGEIQGNEMERMSNFLRASNGVPQFDLEFAGEIYCKCVLTGALSGTVLTFTFDSVSAVELKSRPRPRYT